MFKYNILKNLLFYYILILVKLEMVKNTKDEILKELKEQYNFSGRLKFRVLTPLELTFFQLLINITNKYPVYVFPKVKVSDLIWTNNKSNIGKINSKHIDFVICDIYSHPVLFVELDDSTHNAKSVIERDIKKDIIFNNVYCDIFRVTPENQIERIHQIDLYLSKLFK